MMDDKQFRYTIGSYPDRENLVLDIFVDNKMILNVTQEPDHSFEMEIYPPYEGNFWKLDFEGFKEILERGMRRFERFCIGSPQPMQYIRQQLSYSIVTMPGRKKQALHIFAGNKQLLKISKKPGGSFEIEIYPLHEGSYKFPLPDGDFWKLDYLKFRAILDEGMKVLEQLF